MGEARTVQSFETEDGSASRFNTDDQHSSTLTPEMDACPTGDAASPCCPLKSVVVVASQSQMHDGLLDRNAWPDLRMGQRQPLSRNTCDPKSESFANKVGSRSPLTKLSRAPSSGGGSPGSVRILQRVLKDDSETVIHSQSCSSSGAASLVPSSKEKSSKKILERKVALPPKDTRVKLIDATLMNQVYVLPKQSMSKAISPNNFALQDKDFPELSLAAQSENKTSNSGLKNKTFNSDMPRLCKEDIENVSEIARKSSKKQPRSHDPISIDINEVLQDSSKKNQLHQGKYFQRLEVRKCGNFLNVSSKAFKKGKQRETPVKKRLSKLKLVILEERKKKRLKSENICEDICNSDIGWLQCKPVSEFCQESEDQCSPTSCPLDNGNIAHKEASNHIWENEKNLSVSNIVPKSETLQIQLDEAKIEQNQSQCTERKVVSDLSHCNEQLQLSPKQILGPAVHSKKFREYCHNMRSQMLDHAVELLLKELYRFQDRVYKKDPIRAHAKRRFVLGIREVKKFLKLKKLKVVIIAPDLESVTGPGGLDEAVAQIKDEGKLQEIPIVFAVSRQKLGFLTIKKVPISIVGIISYEGAEELLKKMLDEWKIAFDQYHDQFESWVPSSATISAKDEHDTKNPEKELIHSALQKLMEDKEPSLSNFNKPEDRDVVLEDIQECLSNLAV